MTRINVWTVERDGVAIIGGYYRTEAEATKEKDLTNAIIAEYAELMPKNRRGLYSVGTASIALDALEKLEALRVRPS